MNEADKYDYDAIYKAAEGLLCMRQFKEALSLYELVVKAWPNHAGAWHGLAICLERVGEAKESKTAYERAMLLHLKDGSARALLWGGWAAMKLGNFHEAYQLLKQSIDLDPTYPYAWHSLAVAARRIGKLSEAEQAMAKYREMIREKPYDKRECEGARMIREALETASEETIRAIMMATKTVNC